MDLKRGQRDKLEKYVNLNMPVEIEINTAGKSLYNYFCFGVDSGDRLTDENYFIFQHRPVSPSREINYRSSGMNGASFSVDLSKLPQSVNKIVFAVEISGTSVMGDISSHTFTLGQNGSSALRLSLTGADFSTEKAIISVEIYKKDVWRINAVARGFNGGLSDLTKAYGRENVDTSPPRPTPAPTPVTPPAPSPLPARVDLKKGEKVSLVKKDGGLGEILINLNWKQPKGFFARPIDLDLGCLYELKDGSKGTVQALGKRFGSLTRPPYISLDGDDRSGSSVDGENLRINGKMVSEIKRILVYTFIYEGIANWKGADGVVTVKCPGSPEIIVRMDEYGSKLGLCAVALIENVNNTFSVQKIVNFYRDQKEADAAFNWGLKWVVGKKD